jgi:hypothetical protein
LEIPLSTSQREERVRVENKKVAMLAEDKIPTIEKKMGFFHILVPL